MAKVVDYSGHDWQTLLVIDACRYDVFKEVFSEKKIPGSLSKRNSLVPHTAFWYRRHWSYNDNEFVLISSNPTPFAEVGWFAAEKFHKAVWADTASTDYPDVRKRTEEVAGPDSAGMEMFDPRITLEFYKEHKVPGRKHIVHFIPPHLPYFGKKGTALFKKLGLKKYMGRNIYHAIQEYGRQGNWDEVRECYKENVEYVFDVIYENQEIFDKNVIITSDHGELLGEPNFDEEGEYIHRAPAGTPEWDLLCTVPWFSPHWG